MSIKLEADISWSTCITSTFRLIYFPGMASSFLLTIYHPERSTLPKYSPDVALNYDLR
jgi:hypothetical protein